ncbi:MAG: iron-containing alcohol dehydrogenase [Desulfuromonadaceae bacterium]
MAHSLGGEKDSPHGECNAILLDHVVAFNHTAAPERFARIAEAMGLDLRGMGSSERQKALLEKIRDLKKATGLNLGLERLGIDRTDLPSLSMKALKDPCMVTNPRQANQRDIEVVYEEAL